MIKYLFRLIFLSLFLCTACSTEESNEIIQEQDDNDPPTLSVSNIQDTVESAIHLDVSITDSSNNVITSVWVNGNEVFSTTDKKFSYTLDPLQYRNGETLLTIKSVDEWKNEVEKSYPFRIKKLLYRHDSGFSNDSVDSYVALNLMETGELIAFRNIHSMEDISFYATDDFEKQDLVITNYLIDKNNNFHLALSYAGVAPGTIRLTFDELIARLGLEHKWASQNSQIDVEVLNVPFFNRLSMLGYDYSLIASNEPILTIGYDKQFASNILLSYHTNDNANLLDDYRYLFIENFTQKALNFNELKSIDKENVFSITLPETVEKFSFGLNGYNGEIDYKEGYFRYLYGYASETINTGFSFNYPNIKEYAHLDKTLNLDLIDGRKIRLKRLDSSDFKLPELSILQTDNSIKIKGNYDFSTISLVPFNSNPLNEVIFQRKYQSTFSSNLLNPFEKLEIPDAIVEILNKQGFNLKSIDSSGELSLSLIEYKNDITYPEGVFYYPIGNEAGDLSEVIFKLNN